MYFCRYVFTFQPCFCCYFGCYFDLFMTLVLFLFFVFWIWWGCYGRVNLIELSGCTYWSSLSPISWLPYYSHCIALLYFEFINNKEACLLLKKKVSLWNKFFLQIIWVGPPFTPFLFLTLDGSILGVIPVHFFYWKYQKQCCSTQIFSYRNLMGNIDPSQWKRSPRTAYPSISSLISLSQRFAKSN